MFVVLQTLADYEQLVAWSVGGIVVLVLLGYVFLTRNVGRERDEWEQEKAISDGVDELTLSMLTERRQGRAEFLNDIEYMLTSNQKASRVQRLGQWARRRVPFRTWAHARRIEDADGRSIYLVSLNGRRLAHRHVDPLLRDVETVLDAVDNNEEVPGTFAEHYFDDITDGFVDINESRARVRGDCQTRIQANMRRNRELDYNEIIQRFVYDFRYPRRVVEEKMDQLSNRDLRIENDGTVTYQRFQ